MKVSKQTAREAAQLFRACVVNSLLDERRVRDVVGQLAGARPRGYLATLSAFRRLVKIECARHTARIECARPLPPDLQARVLNSLSHTYGPGLTTAFAENPALIGGMRIQVGSDVYDGSIRARLAALQQTF